jgi:predicted ester cyclase
VTPGALTAAYRGYIDCLNRQDWPALGRFVHEHVDYNGEPVGLAGYRAMLERDFEAIPDLRFEIALVVSEPPVIASRLSFDCTPVGDLFGIPVNGKRVQFTEHVFYRFAEGRIRNVFSVIDKAAITAQI